MILKYTTSYYIYSSICNLYVYVNYKVLVKLYVNDV